MGESFLRRHRVPEQLEVLVECYLELGEDGMRAIESLKPSLDRYRVTAGRPGRDATTDPHDLYRLRAAVEIALAILTRAAVVLGDHGMVEVCGRLAEQSRLRRGEQPGLVRAA